MSADVGPEEIDSLRLEYGLGADELPTGWRALHNDVQAEMPATFDGIAMRRNIGAFREPQ